MLQRNGALRNNSSAFRSNVNRALACKQPRRNIYSPQVKARDEAESDPKFTLRAAALPENGNESGDEPANPTPETPLQLKHMNM